MHCQRKFVTMLMNEAGADYCLAVKQNQGKLCKEIELCFSQTPVEHHHETKEVGHGRKERRLIEVLPGELLPKELLKVWLGLKEGCIVRQTSWRTEIQAGGKEEETTEKVRYFISSLSPTEPEIAKQLLRADRKPPPLHSGCGFWAGSLSDEERQLNREHRSDQQVGYGHSGTDSSSEKPRTEKCSSHLLQ